MLYVEPWVITVRDHHHNGNSLLLFSNCVLWHINVTVLTLDTRECIHKYSVCAISMYLHRFQY